MAIILEGPNGTGKSTLAKELHGLTGYPIISYKKRNIAEVGSSIAESMNDAGTKNLIMDRFPAISEVIYAGFVDKRPSIVSASVVEKVIKNYHIKRNKTLFLIMSPLDVKDTFDRQHDKHFGFSTYEFICNMYKELEETFTEYPHVLPVYGNAIDPYDIYVHYKNL